MAISNLVTSPHVVCYINSIPFARCAGLTYSVTSPKREVHGIDILTPVELVPTSVSLHGTLQVYRMHFDGGAEAAGLLGTWRKLTKEKYFSLMVLDRKTDTVLVKANRCSVIGQDWRILTKSFIFGTISWSGIDYENDAE